MRCVFHVTLTAHLVHAWDAKSVVLSTGGDGEIVVIQIVLGTFENLPAAKSFRLEVYAYCRQPSRWATGETADTAAIRQVQ